MTPVLEGLLMGDIEDAYSMDALQAQGVTHLLTVHDKPLPSQIQRHFTYWFVHALDMEDTDLLSHFQACIDFMEEGRKAGGVLVHCFAGQSRSAALVLAYLMQKLDMTLEDSMTLLKKFRPQVRPNEGFLTQLQLFESMGNKIDKGDNTYKIYRLNCLALRIQAGRPDGEWSADTLSPDPALSSRPHDLVYKCRKCRRCLFRGSGILSHHTGQGQTAFSWRSRMPKGAGAACSAGADICRQSLFIEPVCWMAEDILSVEGKIACPKCHAKLGSFNWFGEPCPCGTWVTPAFHIQTSKVDRCTPRPQMLREVAAPAGSAE